MICDMCVREGAHRYTFHLSESWFSRVLEDVSLNFCPHVNIAYMPSQDKRGQRLSQ